VTVGTVGPVTVNRVNADSTTTNVSDDALTGLNTISNGSIRITADGTITVNGAIMSSALTMCICPRLILLRM